MGEFKLYHENEQVEWAKSTYREKRNRREFKFIGLKKLNKMNQFQVYIKYEDNGEVRGIDNNSSIYKRNKLCKKDFIDVVS